MVAIRIQPNIPTHQTQEYLQVLREADTQSPVNYANGLNLSQGGDGQLSGGELSGYTQRLGQQKQFLQFFDNMFQNFLGYSPFGQALEEINNKLDVAQIMQAHFNVFATGQNITQGGIFDVAGNDGNYNDVTAQDLGYRGPVVDPPQPPPIDYANNDSLLDAMIDEIPAGDHNPYAGILRTLASQLGNVDPESPQALAINSRIVALGQQAGMSDAGIQRFTAMSSLRSLNSLVGDLNALTTNLDPDSPQYEALQTRIEGVNRLREDLIHQIDPTRPIDFESNTSLMNGILREVPSGENNPSAALLRNQVTLLQHVEPESPQALAIMARIHTIGAQAGVSEQGLERITILTSIRSMNNITGSLHTLKANLDPDSSQLEALEARLEALNRTRQDLAQQYQALL